jgi:anti-sigma28 factor (negative regulator of flagellin synthesis)
VGKDRASLSESARLLARARAHLEESPATRAGVVQALKERVASGTYQVPLEGLVQRLLQRLKGD